MLCLGTRWVIRDNRGSDAQSYHEAPHVAGYKENGKKTKEAEEAGDTIVERPPPPLPPFSLLLRVLTLSRCCAGGGDTRL